MDPGAQMKKTGFACSHILPLFFPKNVFLTLLALLMKLNYSTWVQNEPQDANICFLHSSREKQALP